MRKAGKDRVVNYVRAAVAAVFLLGAVAFGISPCFWIPLGLILIFSARPITRKALYNELDRMEARVRGQSQNEQMSAVKELAEHGGPRAIALLLEAMDKEIPRVRLAAAQALLEVGDTRATAFLVEAMQSENTTLRKGAAGLLADAGWKPQTPEERVAHWIAFGDFFQPVGQGIAAVSALVKAFDLNRTDAAARTDIVWALARIATAEVIDPLMLRMQIDESKAVQDATDKALKGLVSLMTEAQRSAYVTLSTRLARKRTRTISGLLPYFEVPIEVSVYRCSDQECPCPGTESLIPGETGYLYVSPGVVEMRRDALTMEELQKKVKRMTDAIVFFDHGTIYPVFMCRKAAVQRNIDLGVAATDAKNWVATGRVPLRVTPRRT